MSKIVDCELAFFKLRDASADIRNLQGMVAVVSANADSKETMLVTDISLTEG